MKSQRKNYSRKNKNTKRNVRRNVRSRTRKMRGGTLKQLPLELTKLLLNENNNYYKIHFNLLNDKLKFMLFGALSYGNDKLNKEDQDELNNKINELNPGLKIVKNTHLKTLEIDSITHLNDVENLMDALSLNETLETLTINYVTINKKYAEFIALSLLVNKSLKTLNLIQEVDIDNDAKEILTNINSSCKIMIKDNKGKTIRINYDKNSNKNNLEHSTKYYEAPHYDIGAANNNVTSKIVQRFLAALSKK
jgi:hypothetical protein